MSKYAIVLIETGHTVATFDVYAYALVAFNAIDGGSGRFELIRLHD